MKKIFWTSLKKYFEYFWENIFKVFEKYFKNYSVTPGPFFWEFVTESVNMKVKKVWWWWWGGGLFDYSVSPGPFFWEFDTEFWAPEFRPGPRPWTGHWTLTWTLDPDLELDNSAQITSIWILSDTNGFEWPHLTFEECCLDVLCGDVKHSYLTWHLPLL